MSDLPTYTIGRTSAASDVYKRPICFRNERAAREFAALLHSRRAWQLERNAEEKGADSPE